MALYDRIGRDYSGARRTELRIARYIWDALGDARTVLNVGAGTGSYDLRTARWSRLTPSPSRCRSRADLGARLLVAG